MLARLRELGAKHRGGDSSSSSSNSEAASVSSPVYTVKHGDDVAPMDERGDGDDGVESSDTEAKRARAAKVRTKKRPPEARPRPPPPPPPRIDQTSLPLPGSGTTVLGMAELLEKFPHLDTDPQSSDRCAGSRLLSSTPVSSSSSSSSSSSLSLVTRPAERIPLEWDVNDTERKHLELLRGQLPAPRLTMETAGKPQTQEELSDGLKEVRVALQEMPLAYETEQLGASGRHVLPNGMVLDYPPCKNGTSCCALTADIKTRPPLPASSMASPRPVLRGCVLQQFMLPDQHREFVTRGVAPSSAHPCLLCLRRLQNQIIATQRGSSGATRIHLIQYYRVKCGIPGGYKPSHCWSKMPDGGDGVVDYVVKYRPGYLSWYINAQGRQMIDQSLLLHDEPLAITPLVGENLQGF